MSQTQIIDPSLIQIIFEAGVLQITWPPDAVPVGYSVLAVVTDADGAALSPAPDIQYSGSGATVSSPALVGGAQIVVALRLVAPANTPTPITLQTLPQVDAPQLSFSAAGIDITWTPVSGADRYVFDVQDENGETALSPTLQGPDQPNQASLAFNELAAKATYRIRVRAGAAHARGPWSDFTSISVDKTLPTNPDLLALYHQLHDAGSSLQLGPDLVQASNITGLFASLLGQVDQTVPVENAHVSATPGSVTLQGDVTLFKMPPLASTFVFTVPAAMVQMQLSVTLGSISVAQLQTIALAPPDIFTSDGSMDWVGGLANIENALLQVDSHTGEALVTSTGDGPAWSVLGLSNATLGKVQPELRTTVLVAGEPPYHVAQLTTQLDLSSTHPLNIYLQLPAGYNPWQLGLSNPFYIGGFADIYALFGGQRLALPTQFESLGQLTLNQLMMRHPPQSKRWSWYVAATLTAPPAADDAGAGAAPTWTIIAKVLELEQLSMTLDADVYDTSGGFLTASAGTIGAHFRLGALTALDVLLQVPDQNGTWTLSASTSQTFQLADTAQLLNDDTTALSTSISKIGATKGFTLEQLRISFDLETPQITAFSVAFAIQEWAIDGFTWLTMNQIHARLDVQNPREAAQRLISGELSSVMTIGSVQVGVLTAFDQQAIWQVRLRAQSAQLGGLDDLRNFVSSSSVISALPAGLPTGGGLQLAAFTMRYDSQNKYLPEVTFGLDAALGWDLVPGLFYIGAIHIALQVSQDSPSSDKVVTGEVSALLGVGPAQFIVSASKPEASDPWTFNGSLAQSLHIDFAALLQTLLSTEWKLPSGYGFPTSVTILAADATLAPSTGKFDFTGDALTEWSITFASTAFAVVALGGEVHIPGSDEADQSKRALIVGDFEFGELVGRASLQLGTQSAPVVLDVVISDAAPLDVPSMVNKLCTADQSNVYDQVPAPAEFTKPHFFQAGLHVDLTNNVYALYGQYAAAGADGLYAAVALLVKKETVAGGATQWGFIFAAMLQNWRFALIASELSVVDTVLSVKKSNAAIALSLLDAQTDETINTYIPAINTQLSVRRGLNFYAELEFTSGLLSTLATILGVSGQGPFTISGYIPADAGQSEFTASLKNLTLLGFLEFNDIVLTYKTAASSELTLKGEIVVHVGDAHPTFQGDLLVNAQQASFSVQTTQTIDNPLGLPRITIDQLKFSLTRIFATPSASAQLTIVLEGEVTAFSGLTLTGFVLFKDGATVVAGARIVQQLSIDALFQKYLSSAWPTGLLAIAFKDGSLYYAPQAVTVDGTEYAAGFHLSAHVDIYFLHDILIGVDIQDGQQIQASATWPTVIDWRFIRFYGATDNTLGPAVALNSTDQTFSLTCGVELFEAPILDQASITIGAQAMSGSLRFAQALGPLAGATLDFTLDDQGFHVTNLPLDADKLPKLIFDLADFLQDASNVECPVDFITKLAIESRLHLSPSMSISLETVPGNNGAAPASAPFLNLTVNGALGLVTNSAIYDGDIITANLVEATLKVPFPGTGAFTWDMLGDKLIECIKSAAQSIFHNLVQDPQNLAKLLAVKGIEFTVSKLADYFVCKGLSAEAAEAAAAAATGAATAEVVVDGVAVTVGGVVGVIVGGVFTNHAGGDPAKPKPATPGAPTVLRYVGDQLHVEWSAVDNANLYRLLYAADGGGRQSSDAVTGTALDLLLAAGARYRVQIVAAGDGGVSAPGPAAEIQTFAAPGGLTVAFQDPVLSVQWQDVTGGQAEYQVDVLHNGQSLGTALTVTASTPTSRQFQSAQFENGGDFTVTVYAQTATVTSPTASQPIAIVLLPAPAAPTLQSVGSTIEARWTPTAGATYTVRVLDANGQPLTTPAQVTVDNQQGRAVIAGASIQSGQNYRIALKQSAANAVGQYSPDATITASFLAAPANFAVQLTLPAQQLTATWVDQQAEATGYAIEVLDAADQPLAPPLGAQVANGRAPAQLAAAQLATGTLYHVRARLLGATSIGEWCQPAPLQPVALAKPTGLRVTNQPDKVTVQCDPITNANAYQAEILTVDGRAFSPPLVARSATPTVELDARRLALNSQYQVRIQALSIHPGDLAMPDAVAAPTSQILGPYSDAISFTRSVLKAPTALTIIYDLALNQLTVSWTDDEPNVKFELGVWAGPATGDPVIQKSAIASSPYTLPEADRASLTAGQSYTFQVRAEQDGSLSPWSEPVELPIITLAQPANLHVINLPTQIGVSCDAVTVTGAALWGYEAEVLDDATGNPLPTPLKAQSTTLPVYLDASALTTGTAYKIHMRAIATATPSQSEANARPNRARRTSRR